MAYNGKNARLSMHNKCDDGTWQEIVSTGAYIGRNGLGKKKEGDGKTPIGVFSFTHLFGNKDNPGTRLRYTCVDGTYYWVDDVKSRFYNRFVSTKNVRQDWKSAEHIKAVKKAYNYVIALDYNRECVKGKGSAIFIHCATACNTSGCIAVSEEAMEKIMVNLKKNCKIVINYENRILK